jgi:hypothetical protein
MKEENIPVHTLIMVVEVPCVSQVGRWLSVCKEYKACPNTSGSLPHIDPETDRVASQSFTRKHANGAPCY